MDASRPSLASGADFGRRRRPRGHHARLGLRRSRRRTRDGLIGGVCCFWGAVFLKRMAGWDDSLDAFGVHGVGGIVGALLTGVFSSSAVTGSEMNPVMTQVGIQTASVVATMVYAGAVSWTLLKIIDVVMGLRVTSDEERMGLDLSLHGERIE